MKEGPLHGVLVLLSCVTKIKDFAGFQGADRIRLTENDAAWFSSLNSAEACTCDFIDRGAAGKHLIACKKE
jgi:hypothetical protein